MNKNNDELRNIERQEDEFDEVWIRIANTRKTRRERGLPLRRIHTGISLNGGMLGFEENPGPVFDYAKMADHILDTMAGYDVAGYTYAIVQNGWLKDAAPVGYARFFTPLEPDTREMDTETLMVSASLAKPVCGVSIMKLVEEGRIKLTDQVGSFPSILTFYPNMHNSVKSVTIYELLTHTSGIPKGGTYEDGFNNPTQFPQYSNKNYSLLGWIIEDITSAAAGETGSYVDYVKENILAPMTITKMSNKVDSNPCKYYSLGLLQGGGTVWGDSSTNLGPHGWYASAIDWAKFLAYFRYNKVISSTSRIQMLNDPNTYFGFRKWFGEKRGTYWGHGGSWYKDSKGFEGGIMGFPDGVDAVLLINTYDTYDLHPGFDAETILIDAYHAGFA
jgi:CubicO group peptidase (beta-lactamase class C family)